MNKSYKRYLKSDKWDTIRNAVIERDNYQCAICSSPDNLHVHHLTYENVVNEKDEDLVTLCKGCHFKEFDQIEKDQDFIKVYKLFTSQVLEDLEYLNGALSLLFWFMDKVQDLMVNDDPIVYLEAQNVEKELQVSRTTLYKYLKLLKDKDYIEQIQNRSHVYRVNPSMIFKGTLDKKFKNNRTGQGFSGLIKSCSNEE